MDGNEFWKKCPQEFFFGYRDFPYPENISCGQILIFWKPKKHKQHFSCKETSIFVFEKFDLKKKGNPAPVFYLSQLGHENKTLKLLRLAQCHSIQEIQITNIAFYIRNLTVFEAMSAQLIKTVGCCRFS